MPENSLTASNDTDLLITQLNRGDKKALNKLYPLFYNELRNNARKLRYGFFDMETLNTTSIVHEVYIKLLRSGFTDYNSRAHFLYISSKAMRHILVNASEKKRTLRRGGNEKKIYIDDMNQDIQLTDRTSEEILLINDALENLKNKDDRQARIVECRFFGGMSVKETATALDISPATVKRSWSIARTWLYSQLHEG